MTLRDATEETRAVLARRMEIVARMFAGEATYADVLELHADDFVWLSAAGVKIGHREAAEHNAERMSRIPPEVCGEYGFVMFKTDAVPFGTDTYRVVDGKVVFQSNALYLPRRE